MLMMTLYLTDADGVSHHLEKSTYNYDADAYEPTGEGEPFEEFFTDRNAQIHRLILIG